MNTASSEKRRPGPTNRESLQRLKTRLVDAVSGIRGGRRDGVTQPRDQGGPVREVRFGEHTGKIIFPVCVVGALIVIIAPVLIGNAVFPYLQQDWETHSARLSVLSPIVAAAWAFAGVILLVGAMLVQAHELQLQRKDSAEGQRLMAQQAEAMQQQISVLKEQRKALGNQNKQLKRQNHATMLLSLGEGMRQAGSVACGELRRQGLLHIIEQAATDEQLATELLDLFLGHALPVSRADTVRTEFDAAANAGIEACCKDIDTAEEKSRREQMERWHERMTERMEARIDFIVNG